MLILKAILLKLQFYTWRSLNMYKDRPGSLQDPCPGQNQNFLCVVMIMKFISNPTGNFYLNYNFTFLNFKIYIENFRFWEGH